MARMFTPQGHGLGWRPGVPDQRDYFLAEHRPLPPLMALPPSLDLRSGFTPVRD